MARMNWHRNKTNAYIKTLPKQDMIYDRSHFIPPKVYRTRRPSEREITEMAEKQNRSVLIRKIIEIASSHPKIKELDSYETRILRMILVKLERQKAEDREGLLTRPIRRA